MEFHITSYKEQMAQPAAEADHQGAKCESEEYGFSFSAKKKVERRWVAA